MDGACRDCGVDPRSEAERAAILVPTWSIETWLAYLDGETVDESRPDYPKLQEARDCARHVVALYDMCAAGRLREPAPASLKDACREFHDRIEPERS